MPERSTHLATGAIVGAMIAICHPGLSHLAAVDRILLGTGLGALGGVAPDLLEPADSPSHRGVVHSLASLGLMSHSASRTCSPALAIFLGGAISHLALDASTPAGLPFLAKGA